MKVNEYYSNQNEWLKGDDLPAGKEFKVTIDRVEEVRFGDKEPAKLALRFVGKEKGVVLNKTNAGRLVDVHGDETDDWVGKEIFLYSEPVEFNGQMVRSVRLRCALQQADEMNDDIPF